MGQLVMPFIMLLWLGVLFPSTFYSLTILWQAFLYDHDLILGIGNFMYFYI